MKKTVLKILTCLICVCFALSAFACNSSVNFNKTTLKNWGATEGNYGFVSTTANYIYFINGVGTSTADNTFGAPVKGALMVADKTDLTNAQIAVPKLFVATDYESGLFIFGEGNETYVYYGTPNTEKNSSGNVANNELVFSRTRLDGENTSTFVTVDGISTEYRFAAADGTVYLVYKSGNKLIEYNTKTGVSKTVAETDVKKSESLDTVLFCKNGDGTGFTAVYTVTCYEGAFVSEGTRTKAAYNKVYAYKAGSDPECILNGAMDSDGYKISANDTYKISLFKGEYLFVDITAEGGSEATAHVYNLTLRSINRIANTGYTADSVLIEDWDNIYVADGDKIYKSSFITADKDNKEVVANVSASKLLFIKDGKIYYTTSDNKIARCTLGSPDGQVIVANETVYLSWFAPELIGDDLFYVDDDRYVKYIDVTAAEVYDDENDITTLGDGTAIGKKLPADEAAKFTSALNKLYIEKDGEVTDAGITEAQNIFDALSSDAKTKISENSLKKFENYKTAYTVAVKFDALKTVKNYDNLSDDEKTALRAAYDSAKTAVAALSDANAIRSIVSDNLNWYYQKAATLFEE